MNRLFPCGLARRELLWEMGGGFAGVALAGMLGREARADGPLAPRRPHHAGKAKACIFLMMNGGPSQVDTFDPKPTLARFAGTEMPKDKKFINSGAGKSASSLPNSGRSARAAPAACPCPITFPSFARMPTSWP